jgi:hypothetical protein
MPSDLLEHMREDVETTARAPLEAFSERAKQMGVAVETVTPDLSTGDVGTEVSRQPLNGVLLLMGSPSSR